MNMLDFTPVRHREPLAAPIEPSQVPHVAGPDEASAVRPGVAGVPAAFDRREDLS